MGANAIHFGGEWGGQLDATRFGGRKRLAHAPEHDLFPGADPRPEFLPQLRIGHARRPELGLQPHETRREISLVEAPRLRPFLREPARAAVHLLLAREQLAVRLVEDGDDELVLGTEVVIDERVVDAGVLGDLPGAERGIALLGEPAVRGIEDLRLGGAEVRSREELGALGVLRWRGSGGHDGAGLLDGAF